MGRGKAGSLNNKAKLTDADVVAIRASLDTQPTLAARYGVSVATISDIRIRRTWRHLSEQPKPECESLPGEEWRPVPHPKFRDRYFVSNLGRIKGASTDSAPIKIRQTKVTRQGYVVVVMCSDARQKRYLVHRFVARAFLGEPPLGHVVNHIDGNKLRNALTNLEYVTPRGNTEHAIRIGLVLNPKGRQNPKAKLTDDDVRHIRASTLPGNIVAINYGVHKETIYRIRRKELWTHI